MYEHIIPLLQAHFKSVLDESYQDINPSTEIVYPYLTWSYQDDYFEHNVDEIYIDVDIFHRGTNIQQVYEIQGNLRNTFEHLEAMTDDIYFRVLNFSGGSNVPKPEETLKQRTIQIQARIDWRRK